MAASEHDVRHAATLAGLPIDAERARTLVPEVQALLARLAALHAVGTRNTAPAVGIGAGGMPLRADDGAPYHMARPLADVCHVDSAGRIVRRAPSAAGA